jgi:Sec-independent protein translocase protein TatA
MSSVGPVELFIIVVIAIVVAALIVREIGRRGR